MKSMQIIYSLTSILRIPISIPLLNTKYIFLSYFIILNFKYIYIIYLFQKYLFIKL